MDHAGGGKRMKRRKSGDAQRPQSNLYERKRGKAKSKEKPNDAPSPPDMTASPPSSSTMIMIRRRHSTVESNIITIDLTCLLLHDD